MEKTQRGLGLVGLMMAGIVIVMLVILGMKVLPAVTEYYTIVKNVKAIAAEGHDGATEIRKAFDRRAQIDSMESLAGRDLTLSKEGKGYAISFYYEKKIPLIDKVSLVIEFEGSSK